MESEYRTARDVMSDLSKIMNQLSTKLYELDRMIPTKEWFDKKEKMAAGSPFLS